MAYIGMRTPVFAPITARTDGSAITYGTPLEIGKGVRADLTFESADNPDRGSDVIVNNDKGINGYNITLETTHITPEGRAAVLGWKPVTGTGSTVQYYDVTDAAPPEGGLGFVRVTMDDEHVKHYEVFFFHALQCSSNGESAATKAQQIEWNHPTINASGLGVYIDASGEAKYFKYGEFNTESAARSFIYSCFGTTAPSNG